MASERIGLLGGALAYVVAVWIGMNVALDRTATWVEDDQGAYLWYSEEWLNLLQRHNFEGRGHNRVMYVGSSEGREGFLTLRLEQALPGWDVYNLCFSNATLGTLRLALDYMEHEYGIDALPDKLVIAATPWFMLDHPSMETSYYPRVLNRYTPRLAMDVESSPPRLVRKDLAPSIASRWRFLTHQTRRYNGGLRWLLRSAVLGVRPEWVTSTVLRLGVVPSIYHHLQPRDKAQQLEQLRKQPFATADPRPQVETMRAEFADFRAFARERDIDLYVVAMPQSTLMIDEYYGPNHRFYLEELGRLVEGLPYLDLTRFLRDDEFYDLGHARRAGAEKITDRLVPFILEADGASNSGAG